MSESDVKRISFEDYQKYFYDFISVNGPNKEASTVNTPIFFKLDDLNIICITFSFERFIIIVKVSLSELQLKYDTVFEGHKDDESFVKPELMSWINEHYMDGRGIKEV